MRRGVWQPPKPSDRTGRWGKISHFYMENEIAVVGVMLGLFVLSLFIVGFNVIIIGIVFIAVLLICAGFPIFVIFAGTIYGITSALTISGAIINERLQGRYLILGVTPSGFLGASWALCSLSIQNSVVLRQLRNILRSVYTMMTLIMVLPFILATLFYVVNSNSREIYDLWSAIFLAFCFLTFCLVDFFQSACVGSLIGIIAAHHSETRSNTQNSVISNFLSLQMGVYLMAGFLCLYIIPSLFSVIDHPITPFYGVICVGTIYAVREVLIITLWHGLALTIDDDVNQLNTLTRIRIKDRSWMGHLARRLLGALWRNPLD
jgi:hypothetical protein